MNILKKQKSVIKPFRPNNTPAPWLGKSILENAKAASARPAANNKS